MAFKVLLENYSCPFIGKWAGIAPLHIWSTKKALFVRKMRSQYVYMGLVNHASFARFSFNCPSVRCTIICHQYSFMGTISFGHSVMALRSKEEGAFVAWGRPRPHTYIFLTISSGSARHYRVAGQDITQEIDGNYAAAKQGQVKPSYQLLLIFPPSPM